MSVNYKPLKNFVLDHNWEYVMEIVDLKATSLRLGSIGEELPLVGDLNPSVNTNTTSKNTKLFW
jgi:hypothetical protein